MSRLRKRPCRNCLRWFYPDPRVGDRIDQRHAELAADPEPLRVPAPLLKLPWDIAKDQFGAKGIDFIAVMGKYLLHAAKDPSPSYPIDPKGFRGNNPPLPRKTRAGGAHTETEATPHHAANSGVSSIGPPGGAPPGPPPGSVPAAAGVAG